MIKPPHMSFLGDMSISHRQWSEYAANREHWSVGGVADRLSNAAAVVGNLECLPLSANWTRSPRKALMVDAGVLDFFTAFHVRYFSLANNHIMDAGADGLSAVMEELDSRNLAYFGAGNGLEAAESPLHINIAGKKIALLGACDASYVWATQVRAGVAPMIASRLLGRIRAVRDTADHVVVILHGGAEFNTVPEHPRVRLSRALAEAGATAIIQHHPHVVQPIEYHENVPILYSLGNFCFEIDGNAYMQQRSHVRNGLIAHVSFADRAHLELDDIYIEHHGRPILATRATDVDKILTLGNSILSNPTALQSAWQACADTESRQLLGDAYWAIRKHGISAGYRAIRHSLSQPRLRACLGKTIGRGFF
jgi:hypothetical protein